MRAVAVFAVVVLVGITVAAVVVRRGRERRAVGATLKALTSVKLDALDLVLEPGVVELEARDGWGRRLRVHQVGWEVWSLGSDGIEDGGAGDDIILEIPAKGQLRVEYALAPELVRPEFLPRARDEGWRSVNYFGAAPPPSPASREARRLCDLVVARLGGERVWRSVAEAVIDVDFSKRAFIARHHARGLRAFQRAVAELRAEASK